MAYVEALALGATAIVFGIVKLLEVKNNANIDWADVFITIGAMGTVVAAFGALAAIAGIKPVVALMLAGSVGLGAAALLALGATKLMFNIVELIDEKNKANITWEDVYSTIDAMSTTVSTFGGLAVVASLATPFILSGIPAMAILGVLASANIKVLRSLVNVTAAVNELGPDGWTQITTAVTKMSNIISNDDEHNPGFAQLSKKATANLITISLGAVALKKVAVTANVAAEALIQMCNAAAALKGKESTDITNVISTFEQERIMDSRVHEQVFGLQTASTQKLSKTFDIVNVLSDLNGKAYESQKKAVLNKGIIKAGANGEFEYSALPGRIVKRGEAAIK